MKNRKYWGAVVIVIITIVVVFFQIFNRPRLGTSANSREQRFSAWMEQCREIRPGMSQTDVINKLGRPDGVSAPDEKGTILMSYSPPFISRQDKNSSHGLTLFEFAVIITNGSVDYSTFGYE